MIIALALLLAASDKLPPVKLLPIPEQSDEAAVLRPVNAFLAAIAARDGAAAAAQNAGAGTITVAGDSIRHMSWPEFAASIKPGPERYEERLPNPAIEIDGEIAMVWGHYDFLIDGKPDHCGADHFDLVRKDGSWKIVNVSWSRRTGDCAD